MIVETLNTVTEKLILPHFPWIEEFKWWGKPSLGWHVKAGFPASVWFLDIKPKRKFGLLGLSKYIPESEKLKLQGEIQSIFNMLGLSAGNKFGGVRFNK